MLNLDGGTEEKRMVQNMRPGLGSRVLDRDGYRKQKE